MICLIREVLFWCVWFYQNIDLYLKKDWNYLYLWFCYQLLPRVCTSMSCYWRTVRFITHWEWKKKKNTPDIRIMISHIWNHLSSHSLVFTFASVLNWSDHIIIIHSYATQIISFDLSAATIHHTYTIYYWQAQECPSARFIKGWDIVVLIS